MLKSPRVPLLPPFPSTRKQKRERQRGREKTKTRGWGTSRGADHNMKKQQLSLFTQGGFPFSPFFKTNFSFLLQDVRR